MNTDQRAARSAFEGKHSSSTELILRVFYEVYNELGAGFLESVYHAALIIALRQSGMDVASQVSIPVQFRGHVIGDFRADIIVERAVLLELKACQNLDSTHEGQVLNYLHATPFEVALLLNFGPRPQIKRFVLDNEQKRLRVSSRPSAVPAKVEGGR